MEPLTVPMLEDPGANLSRTTEIIFAKEVQEYIKRSQILKGNLAAAHATMRSQCSEDMKSKMRALDGYKTKT